MLKRSEKTTEVIDLLNTALLVRDYQWETNRSLAFICRVMVILIIAVGLLNYLHIFKISNSIYPALGICVVILMLPTFFYDILKWNYLIIRYSVMTMMVLMAGMLYAIVSYHVIIMLVFPLVVSTLYCDKNSVLFTSVINIPVMIVAHLIAFQLKIVTDEPLVT